MMKLERSPGAYTIVCAGFQMQFVYREDRWQHRLLLGSETAERLLLASVEGTPDDARPPSPAFQDLFVEQPAPQICEVQLMGQAGRQIYSGVISIDGQHSLIDFDLCVVSKEPPGQEPAGHSRYQLADGVEISTSTSSSGESLQTVRLQADGEQWELASFSSDEFTDLSLSVEKEPGQRLAEISLQGSTAGGFVQSRRNQRWRYTLRRVERA